MGFRETDRLGAERPKTKLGLKGRRAHVPTAVPRGLKHNVGFSTAHSAPKGACSPNLAPTHFLTLVVFAFE